MCAWDGVVLRLPKNRMNELFTSGSVGGPAGNRRPYPTGLASARQRDQPADFLDVSFVECSET